MVQECQRLCILLYFAQIYVERDYLGLRKVYTLEKSNDFVLLLLLQQF